MFSLVEDKVCRFRGIWLLLQHPACFFQMAECALATPVNASWSILPALIALYICTYTPCVSIVCV